MPKTNKQKDVTIRANALNLSRPNNRNVNSTPISHLLKTEGVTSDCVKRWSDLVSDPFHADAEGVYMPLAEDSFPCPSIKYSNYGATEVSVGVGMCCVKAWFYPEGWLSLTEQPQFPKITANGQVGILGCALAPVVGASFAGVWSESATVDGDTAPNFASCSGLAYDALTSPTQCLNHAGTSQSSPLQVRTSAFGIRISFIGKLTDTEGYIEFFNPFENFNVATGTTQDLTALRRDPSYRRDFFSAKRTYTYVNHPNCNSVKYCHTPEASAGDASSAFSRMMVRIGGLVAGDKILIEYMVHQECTINTLAALNTPVTVAPDAIHLANALAGVHGHLNPKDGKKPPQIVHAIAASKVQHHPWLHAASRGVTSAASLLGGLAMPAAVKKIAAAVKQLGDFTLNQGGRLATAAVIGPLLA